MADIPKDNHEQLSVNEKEIDHKLIAELHRSQLGVRMLSVLLALDIAKNFVSPAMWILGESRSVVGIVARLATWPDMLAVTWIAAAVLVAPYIAMQTFFPRVRYQRAITRMACNGVCLGGIVWMYMAYISRNLDYGIATWLFVLNSVASVALGGVLAFGLNSEQKAAAQDKTNET